MSKLHALVRTIRRRFPELVELYDNTASLQNRTVTTGVLSHELARRYGAALVVGTIDEDRVQGMALTAERKTAMEWAVLG